jgi:hypothetical protein
LLPAISTREIRCGGSCSILAAPIKIDIERLKNSPRLFQLAPNSDRAVEPPSQDTVDHRTPADVSDLIEGFVERFAAGKVDLASARCDLSFALDKVEFPWDGDWLNGVLQLNSWLRSSWRDYDWQRVNPVILNAWPAQEFYRAFPRAIHRDWLRRWTEAGGQICNGKMIALKDDPIWHTLSDFGFPFPPFAPGSG